MRTRKRPGGKDKNSLSGKLKSKHRRALQLVAGGMSQKDAAKRVGFSEVWLSSIINTSEEARQYLSDSRDRMTAKWRIIAEKTANEHIRALFANELGLSKEDREALLISPQAAIQAGLSPTVIRAAGLIDEPGVAPPPPISLRLNVLAILKDPIVAKHALAAANEAAAKGILLIPRDAT